MGGDRALERDQGNAASGTPLLTAAEYFRGFERTELKKPAMFDQLTARGGDSGLPFTSRIDLLKGWSKTETKDTVKVGDAPVAATVKDGVLELSYNDPNFDRKLAGAQGMTTLKIADMPMGKQILTWADDKGYYFFFGKDDQKNHYFPNTLKVIEVAGKKFDMDRSRLQVSESYMAKYTGVQGGFDSFGPRASALEYFTNMSKVGGQGLEWQEKILRDAAAGSDNPYFKIYLADVIMMKAMQPLVSGVLGGEISAQQKQQVLDRLTEAETVLKEAEKLSYGPLYQRNHFPQRNASMPLAPGAFLFTPPPGSLYDPYFAYWGGAWDQSLRREAFITMAKGLVNSNAIQWFQLPPDMSRR